jgi:hypothetical protein
VTTALLAPFLFTIAQRIDALARRRTAEEAVL